MNIFEYEPSAIDDTWGRIMNGEIVTMRCKNSLYCTTHHSRDCQYSYKDCVYDLEKVIKGVVNKYKCMKCYDTLIEYYQVLTPIKYNYYDRDVEWFADDYDDKSMTPAVTAHKSRLCSCAKLEIEVVE